MVLSGKARVTTTAGGTGSQTGNNLIGQLDRSIAFGILLSGYGLADGLGAAMAAVVNHVMEDLIRDCVVDWRTGTWRRVSGRVSRFGKKVVGEYHRRAEVLWWPAGS